MRQRFPRFQKENFDQNLKLVDEVDKIAKAKGCSTGNVAIAWVKAHSGKPAEIIPIPGTTTVPRLNDNMTSVSLSSAELKALDDAVKNADVAGGRYNEQASAWNWG